MAKTVWYVALQVVVEGGAAPRLRQEGPSRPSLHTLCTLYNFSKQTIFGKRSNGFIEQKGLGLLFLRLFPP